MRSLRATASALLHAGYRLTITGRENVPKTGPALVVSNHVAFHDFLFVGVAMGRRVRFVMHQHHFQYPLLRAFFEASRVIPIAPAKQDPARLAAAMEAIDLALADGELVVIFPEGRMTDDGTLSVLRPGLERIVQRRPVPVIPVAVVGLFGSWMSRAHGEPMTGRPHRFRAKVDVRIGAPLPPASATVETLHARLESLLGVERAAARREAADVPG
jgi:1-acyl-sn-glycerol-3-phosphate acyltransferase